MRSPRRPCAFGALSVLAIVAAAVGAFFLLGIDPGSQQSGEEATLTQAAWICVDACAALGVGFAIAAVVSRFLRRMRRRSRTAALRRLSPADSPLAACLPVDVDPSWIPGAGSRSPFEPPAPTSPPARPRQVSGSPGRRRPGRSSRFWSRLLSPSRPASGTPPGDDSRWIA